MKGVFLVKRYTSITGEMLLKSYESKSWELIIEINPEDIVSFYMELQLLKSELCETVTIKSSSTFCDVNISMSDVGNDSIIKVIDKSYKVRLSNNSVDVILAFILKYYKDFCAPVSHFHIELSDNKILGVDGSLTIIASNSAEPISGDDAKKLLGID